MTPVQFAKLLLGVVMGLAWVAAALVAVHFIIKYW
jgi:hypothetical protein